MYRAVVMSETDQLGLDDFPLASAPSTVPTGEADGEPLILEPPTTAQFVAANEVPIAPVSTHGQLPMLSSGEVRPLDELESEIIRFAISHYRGQMSEVARRLKIGRSTLYRKLDEMEAARAAQAAAEADAT